MAQLRIDCTYILGPPQIDKLNYSGPPTSAVSRDVSTVHPTVGSSHFLFILFPDFVAPASLRVNWGLLNKSYLYIRISTKLFSWELYDLQVHLLQCNVFTQKYPRGP